MGFNRWIWTVFVIASSAECVGLGFLVSECRFQSASSPTVTAAEAVMIAAIILSLINLGICWKWMLHGDVYDSPNRSDLVRGDCANKKEPREPRHSDGTMNKFAGVSQRLYSVQMCWLSTGVEVVGCGFRAKIADQATRLFASGRRGVVFQGK